MVLTRPVTKTVISTTEFGQPVYDWIVANTPTPWVNVTFQNGWVNTPGEVPVSYRKVGDIVYLRGRMTAGALSTPAFTLPVGFRPPANLTLPTTGLSGGNWVFAYSAFLASGAYYPQSAGMTQYVTDHVFSTTP